MASVQEVSIDDLDLALRDGAVVVDVREPSEHAEGHVPGVLPIPMGRLPGRVGELPRDQRVYVICASGGRSAAMTEVLVHHGIDAVSVAGGTTAWARSGRPIEKG